MSNARIRNWVFTSFIKPEPDTCHVQYMVYQKEVGKETQREHYQGYVEFNDKYSMRSIKGIFANSSLHLEPRRGTQEQAIAYCKKADTRIEDPVEFGTPKKQGKRSDIAEIMEDIQDGQTMKEILCDHKGNALRMIHCIDKALRVQHGLYAMDDYILLQRKGSKKDRLDEKIEDDLFKQLYK